MSCGLWSRVHSQSLATVPGTVIMHFFLLAFVRLKTLLQFFGDDRVCLPPFLYSMFVVGFSILLFSFSDGSAVPLNVNSIALCLPVSMVSNRPLERLR